MSLPQQPAIGRRPFLAAAAAVAGSWAVPGSLTALLGAPAARRTLSLHPTADETTGLSLLQLPEGFRYLSFGWTGDPMTDGAHTPDSHDGMAVIADENGLLTLCRNHELSEPGTPFGPIDCAYDAHAAGGCTNITFDTAAGAWGRAWPSLIGTVKNCAGGPTPWGTWLSCEETVLEDGDDDEGQIVHFDKPHGYIFEVPSSDIALPLPLTAMGRFVHEAVAVDPETSIVYETEDRGQSGFYRFVPTTPRKLADGGRLEMLKVAGVADLTQSAEPGRDYPVSWVSIDDPERRHSPGTRDEGGVFTQGQQQGGTAFARLEGCWWGDRVCYFASTSGGRAKAGQIWRYDPAQETLRLVFESPSNEVLDAPDNITVSPRGGLVLCEDGDRAPQKLQALSPSGVLTELAWNNVQLAGERNGLQGDFRGAELAGATFSPDGKWLFVNIQTPGITFAITGPWESVGL